MLVYDSKVPTRMIKSVNRFSKNKEEKLFLMKKKKFEDCFLYCKNYESKILAEMLSNFCGVVLEMLWFASSIFKRGLIFVNVPTTLLSQVDSAIGGKTGVNSLSGKNMIGSFYQPSLVISDIIF